MSFKVAKPILAVAVLLLATAAPAVADPPNDAGYRGGCGLVAVNEPPLTGNDVFVGVLYASVAAYSPSTGHNLVQAAVTCRLQINYPNTVASFTTSGTPVAVGATQTTFIYHEGDVLNVCTTVVTVDAHGQSRSIPRGCDGVPTSTEVPPQSAKDVLADKVDPVVCPVLANDVPSVPGVIDIGPDGDLSILGTRYYDCPTYSGGFPAATVVYVLPE